MSVVLDSKWQVDNITSKIHSEICMTWIKACDMMLCKYVYQIFTVLYFNFLWLLRIKSYYLWLLNMNENRLVASNNNTIDLHFDINMRVIRAE